MSRVFVYGILMRDATEAARLPDHRLDFIDGLATVTPHEGEEVHGGVVEVDDWTLRRYDAIEGVRGTDGLYRRDEVTLADGSPAWVYMKTRGEPHRPYTGMLAGIHADYLRLGLPESKLMAALVRADAVDTDR